MRFSSHFVHHRLSQRDAIVMPPASLFSPVLAYTKHHSDTHWHVQGVSRTFTPPKSVNTTSSHDNWCENDWVSHASSERMPSSLYPVFVCKKITHTARNTDLLELCPLSIRRIAASRRVLAVVRESSMRLTSPSRRIYDHGLVHASRLLPCTRYQKSAYRILTRIASSQGQ